MLQKILFTLGFKSNLQSLFTRTYKHNLWHMGSGESRSGLGSSLQYAKSYLSNFDMIIDKYNIKTIFDYSCGDWNWMKLSKSLANESISYIGCDIVDDVIKYNKNKYSNKNIDFICHNSNHFLQHSGKMFDLINIRHTFEHLNHNDIVVAIEASKNCCKYLLITSFDINDNRTNDTSFVADGYSSRPVNLLLSPYKELLNPNNLVYKFKDGKDDDTLVFGYLYKIDSDVNI